MGPPPAKLTVPLTLLVVLCTIKITSAQVFYFILSPDISCPEQGSSCATLSQFAEASYNSTSNVTLVLLPGNHTLNVELEITNITSFSLSSANEHAVINCNQSNGILVQSSGNVQITNLRLYGCHVNITSAERVILDTTTFSHVGSSLLLYQVTNASIVGGGFSDIVHGPSHGIIAHVIVFGQSQVSLTSCTVSELTTYESLDLVYIDSCTVTMSNCTLNNNYAVNGRIVNIVSSTITIDNGSFVNNFGSLLRFARCYSVSMQHNTLIGNIARRVIDLQSSIRFAIEDTVLRNNMVNASVINVYQTEFTMLQCEFIRNEPYYGARIKVTTVNVWRSLVFIDECEFELNRGTAIYSYYNNLFMNNSNFKSNYYDPTFEEYSGTALNGQGGQIWITNTFFTNNTADMDGGAIRALNVILIIENSKFTNNTCTRYMSNGGALGFVNTLSAEHNITLTVINTTFTDNTAYFGGAIHHVSVDGNFLTVTNSIFTGNEAHSGSAVYYIGTFNREAAKQHVIDLTNTTFIHNTRGTTMFITYGNISTFGFLNIQHNEGSSIVADFRQSFVSMNGNTTFSNNIGAFSFINCSVTFNGITNMTNNTPSNTLSSQYQLGGALTSFQSEITFQGEAFFTSNRAYSNGGAILASETKLYFFGNTTIAYNEAPLTGGGIYAYQSELVFFGDNTVMTHNNAELKGGGIQAISAPTRIVGGSLEVSYNNASLGGGMSMEVNANIHIVKFAYELVDFGSIIKLEFKENTADYGGALYIADETNSGTCDFTTYGENSALGECYVQTLQVHSFFTSDLNTRNIFFNNNTARTAGMTVYGGLLDRCTVSPFAEAGLFSARGLSNAGEDSISYIQTITNIDENEINSQISSSPVRVCFCNGNQPNCSYQHSPMEAKKGERFTVSVAAVDQVNNTLPNSTIHSSLASGDGGFREGQSTQNTGSLGCTELEYNVFSPHNTEQLVLYAEGPCNSVGISQSFVEINFLPCSCPIGFEQKAISKKSDCQCGCDTRLSPYITECFIHNSSLLREGNVWISYEQGYVIYQNCPLDYCQPPEKQVYINLDIENGSDSQCAFGRVGTLCGGCSEDLSLVLGTSKCKSCTNHNGLALLIVFAILGIALVAFILVCNLTVAVGTINGLIFYANIIAANRSVFLPFDKPNFLTVIFSWINLDFGIETCFYDGMTGYAKVWLQILFPAYIIFLCALVIIVSHCSTGISKFCNAKSWNPVATLTTLFLLSYTKLLRVVILIVSWSTLTYADGSTKRWWHFDGNIAYPSLKLVPLFLIAMAIIFIGVLYTVLLLLWQLFLLCPYKKGLKWLRNVKLTTLIDTYHAPYKSRKRYWTGLLLKVRVVLYSVFAIHSGNPNENLLVVVVITVSLLLVKEVGKDIVYKNWVLNFLESSFLFNVIILAASILLLRGNNISTNKIATIGYVSTSISFITFIGILIYHTYAFVLPKHLRKAINHRVRDTQKRKSQKNNNIQDGGHQLQINNIPVTKSFNQLRAQLEIFDDEPLTQQNQYEQPTSQVLPQAKEQPKPTVVTHTVIDGLPSNQTSC